MQRLFERFDEWVSSGDASTGDVAIYRIIFAALALLTYPRLQRLSEYPADLFDPPPGPFALLPALPSLPILSALEIAIVVALALLLVGAFTRVTSIAAGLLLMIAFGFTYSFGKVDHTILLVAVPLIMAWSGWGDALSVDAARGGGANLPARAAQWPLRLLALVIGLGFLTAALAKILTGWLNPFTQATQGHFLVKFLFEDKTAWFAPLAYSVNTPWLWEPLDWLTVILELAILVSVLRWRWFRTAIAIAALFHLGVVLLFNISFNVNVLAYGAFVAWGHVFSRPGKSPFSRLNIWTGGAIALVVAVVALAFTGWGGDGARLVVTTGIVFVGAGVAIVYLVREVLLIVRSRRDEKVVAS